MKLQLLYEYIVTFTCMHDMGFVILHCRCYMQLDVKEITPPLQHPHQFCKLKNIVLDEELRKVLCLPPLYNLINL